MRFERALVVGAGQMGSGIAQVLAASGRTVLLHDAAPGAVEKGLATMKLSLEKLAAKGAPTTPPRCWRASSRSRSWRTQT